MTTRKNNTESLTLTERCAKVSKSALDAMTAKIQQQFDIRDAYETARGAPLEGAYFTERNRMLSQGKTFANTKNLEYVARLFVALQIDESFINREVNTGNRFNAYALKKVTELARMVNKREQSLEKVTVCFLACSLAYVNKTKNSVLPNEYTKAFLSSVNLAALTGDSEIADVLADFQHKVMSGGKETQSSQSRNVAHALKYGAIGNNRKTLTFDASSDILSVFADVYSIK